MMKQDLVIVGGGVVGLSAAIAMCLRGFVVSVLDAGVLDGATLQPSARVYALNAASIDLLSQLGVFALIDTNAITPYRAMHVWDAMCGASIDFEAKVLAQEQLGVMVEESAMKRALLERLASLDVALYPHTLIHAVCCVKDH